MSCAEYEHRRAARIARLTRRVTNAEKDAKYVLQCKHKGIEPNVEGRLLQRAAKRDKKELEREAFATLRKLGMV